MIIALLLFPVETKVLPKLMSKTILPMTPSGSVQFQFLHLSLIHFDFVFVYKKVFQLHSFASNCPVFPIFTEEIISSPIWIHRFGEIIFLFLFYSQTPLVSSSCPLVLFIPLSQLYFSPYHLSPFTTYVLHIFMHSVWYLSSWLRL